MATYIPQVQGYVPQYQPFQPDFNFYAGALQMKQSQYDAAHKQLSTLYTSLLNSPLTRDGNIQKRDDIFKMVNQDIKKVSALDLSLAENVNSARKVFDPIYQDDNIVKDMAWTKNYMNALKKADSLKGCLDPKKCGGQYWEEGMQELYYKREEFKNSSDADALSFGDVSYTPFVNVHQKAVDLAKEAGLNVKKDINTGQWIITQKNGELVQGGLYNLFNNALGNDPSIQAMYNTAAYVKRKSYIQQQTQEGKTADVAELEYINSMLATANTSIKEQTNNVNSASDQMNAKRAELLDKQRKGTLTYQELDALNTINTELEKVNATKEKLTTVSNAVNNKTTDDLRSRRARADAAAAHVLSSYDFTMAAQTLSLKDAELTMKDNPYALATHQSNLAFRNSSALASIHHENQMKEIQARHNLDMDNAKFKYLLEQGFYDESLMNPNAGQGGAGNPSITTYGQPDVKQGAPGSTAVLNKEDQNMDIVYRRNLEKSEGLKNSAIDNQIGFLTELYKTAQLAKTPGAKDAIDKIFGEYMNPVTDRGKVTTTDYLNFTSGSNKKVGNRYSNNEQGMSELMADIRKNPAAVAQLYDKALNIVQGNQNCATCDNTWSKNFMSQKYSIQVLDAIETKRQAANAVVNKTVQDIQSVVSSVGRQVSDTKFGTHNPFSDADLMLNQGHLTTEENFVQAYVNRHKSKPEYNTPRVIVDGKDMGPQRVGGGSGSLSLAPPSRDILDDAKTAYETLSQKIYTEYNSRKNIPLDQGYSLTGGGTLNGDALVYAGVDASKRFAGPMRIAKNDINELANNSHLIGSNNFKVMFGPPIANNQIEKGSTKEVAIKQALDIINADLNKRWKNGDKTRPFFTYEMSKIAMNDPNMSARTIKLNPEYYKKLVGSEKNPGVLYTYRDDIASGITFAYDNRQIKLQSDLASEDTDLDYIARYDPKGIQVSVPNGGFLTIKYGPDGKVYAEGTRTMYMDGKKVDDPYMPTFDRSTTLYDMKQEAFNYLMDAKQANDYLDKKAEQLNMMGIKVEGYVPRSQQ